MDDNPAPAIHAPSEGGATAAVPTVGVPTLRTRVVPDGWVSLDAALAWVAFGNAVNLSGWNRHFYFGASRWMEYGPEDFLADLRAIAAAPGQARDGLALYMVMSEARRVFAPASPTSLYGIMPGSVPPESLAAAARSILADTGDEAQGREMREAIWRASNALRREIASGAIKAFGHPGHDHADLERWPPKSARERIPPDVCAAPVTLGQGGIWPFALGDITGTLGDEMETLWHEILIDAPELLHAFPAPDDHAPTVTYHLTPAEKPARVGRPPHVARDACIKEMMRRANTLDGLGNRTDCTRAMIEWAATEFGDNAPGDTTLRDLVRDFWPGD